MQLSPGTKLDGYEVLSLLGAGGMGEVYRARDPVLKREVAIKILPSFVSRDPDRLRRFEQEAEAAAALNHPNILAVYFFGVFDGAPYLVSELLLGETLRQQLQRGPLPVSKAVDYGVQIAHGIAAAHEKGIVHRDLKPENLSVIHDGRVKILDFGLAKLTQPQEEIDPTSPTVASATEPGVVLGTAGYMAPEQVRGQAVDRRADIFAFGAILYEMLTGTRAFQRSTSADTMAAILNEYPPSISHLAQSTPQGLQRVVHRCLEKNPAQRFQSASDLAFALEALSETGSVPAATFAPPAAAKSWRRWIAAVGCALAIVLGILWWFARPAVHPTVESVTQLTDDGQSKNGGIETDGSRIYFNEGPVGSYRIAQVSIHGGQTGDLTSNLLNPIIAGLTGDGSALLTLAGSFEATRRTMWSVPLPVGEARRLGDADVTDARFFPDGRLLYRLDSRIFIAGKDGSNPRNLEELSKYHRLPQISPDGTRLVFWVWDEGNANSWTIYEAVSDGTGVHPVLTWRQHLPTDICCLRWTDNGKYVLFGGVTGARSDLWAFSDERRFPSRPPTAFRLTNGPISYEAFVARSGGKQIFAVGAQRRGELLRYDPKIHDFLPYLNGISAADPTFSSDGKWMAYMSYPEHALWRSRSDGSDRQQLTYSPVEIIFPRISPDGTRVAFSDREGVVYVVSMNGGTPQKLMERASAPNWSPDGTRLAVTCFRNGAFQSQVVDVRNGSISVLPGSQDTLGPYFATQDIVIATANDQSKFVRYDFRTQKWSDILTSPDKFVNWGMSPDGKYFYYRTGGNNPTVFRMRMADNAVEQVVSLKNVRMVNDPDSGTKLNVTPDNSVLVLRDIGTEEVYALSIQWQ
jgi:eukaryotic-like serine/threonine-protein kinase